ncbi:MAG: T9SS type A sorting domain-containing protein, partial [Bacteroidetes bacterium]|nr:T9SS type A sorting domain-containing protein [Bacteroidota bacterium]
DYNASFTIPASERVHNSQPFYKDSELLNFPEIKISATSNNFTDEMAVIFHPEGSAGFDGYYDLETFENVTEAPTVFSLMPEGNFAVNVMSQDYNDVIIPVGFKSGLPGEFILQVTSLSNFSSEYNLYLEDLITGEFFKLYEEIILTRSHNILFDVHRFNLHFTKSTFSIEDQADRDLIIYSTGDMIIVNMPEDAGSDISVYDITGNLIVDIFGTKGNTEYIRMTGKEGYFLVKVNTGNRVTAKIVFIM